MQRAGRSIAGRSSATKMKTRELACRPPDRKSARQDAARALLFLNTRGVMFLRQCRGAASSRTRLTARTPHRRESSARAASCVGSSEDHMPSDHAEQVCCSLSAMSAPAHCQRCQPLARSTRKRPETSAPRAQRAQESGDISRPASPLDLLRRLLESHCTVGLPTHRAQATFPAQAGADALPVLAAVEAS